MQKCREKPNIKKERENPSLFYVVILCQNLRDFIGVGSVFLFLADKGFVNSGILTDKLIVQIGSVVPFNDLF